MRKIIAFLTLELFLISTLGIDFALAQGDLSHFSRSFRTPHSELHTPNSLRPRSGQSTDALRSALDGGKRHSAKEFREVHASLRKKLTRDPEAIELANALDITIPQARERAAELHLPFSHLSPASPLTRYHRKLTTQVPPDYIAKIRSDPSGLKANIMGLSLAEIGRAHV